MENQKSAIGLDGNLAAALGYPIGIIALILIFIEKENKFVRFHAIQSLLWGVLVSIVIMILGFLFVAFMFGAVILGNISSVLGWIAGILELLIGLGLGLMSLAAFGGMIYGAIKAYGNEQFKLPVVGKFAEKWSS